MMVQTYKMSIFNWHVTPIVVHISNYGICEGVGVGGGWGFGGGGGGGGVVIQVLTNAKMLLRVFSNNEKWKVDSSMS